MYTERVGDWNESAPAAGWTSRAAWMARFFGRSNTGLGLAEFLLVISSVLVSVPVVAETSVRVRFPHNGFTTVTTSTSPATPLALSVVNEAGALLLRVQFQLGADESEEQRRLPAVPNTVRFRVVDTPEIGPLVVATAGSVGGSDSSYETTFVAEIDGVLKDVFPIHLSSADEDAICLGHFGAGRRLGVVLANFVWGHEAHFEPHRYDITMYLQSERGSEVAWRHRTVHRYRSVANAFAEAKLQCRNDFVRSLLPEFR